MRSSIRSTSGKQATPASAPEMPSPSTDAVLGTRGGRVLVAEDDEASRVLTSEVLRRDGYEVVAVTDGQQALQALADGTIDLALLDIGLPLVDGLAITRRMRADGRFGSLGILLLTGRVTDSDIVTGLDSGANDYIAKPVQPAVLLARVRSAMRTRRALKGIEAAHGVVAALANAIEAKDASTERHSRRLGTYAAALAQGLGLDEADLHAVTYGALLHDLGKIGVPETVLLKPGPLDEQEWEIMRSHTEIGERIAAPLVGSDRFGPIIRHHHERWDGTGYPDRLRGEDIPLGARIVGIIDAFDAMTRARVYRLSRPVADAVAELDRGRGRQFDPGLTLAFLDLIDHMALVENPSADGADPVLVSSPGGRGANRSPGHHA